MIEDFSDAPVSLAEVRADRAQDSSAWALRDALVALLRRIDKGEVKVGGGVIVYQVLDEHGAHDRTSYAAVGASLPVALGLLCRAQHMMNQE